MTLRSKLLLAQVPLAVAVLLLAFVGQRTIQSVGQSSQNILKDNYQSVLAAQAMKEAIERIDSEAQRKLMTNIEMAGELGAEVVRLRGEDPVVTLLDFARTHGVGHLIVGRAPMRGWRSLVGQTVLQRLLRQADDLDLHIVSFEDQEPGA